MIKTYEEKIAKRGSTPLHIAVQMGDLVIVKYLIEGSNVNAEDNNGYTPLFYAGDLETTKYLLEKGADLVENGASMNDKDNEGYTPLHYAIQIPRNINQ
ncbi:MAG: hypothetical protein DMENIID0003_06920 [Wolbachia endosymbiont of Sergentomyia squamirostris]|uniref:Ankyrin repeat domain protein n=1 Tax=Wolbachia endosymbiont of Sergentomyia squamirostris TaxID=3113640 RepID=A0AAT9GCQ3_9RICK